MLALGLIDGLTDGLTLALGLIDGLGELDGPGLVAISPMIHLLRLPS